jgi:hypothetical protein
MPRPLNAAIANIPLPERLRRLPISDTGFPVPWFVEWIDGKPDFRVMSSERWARAIRVDLCWLCGQTLGRWKVFTAGPMCAINRTSAEPPSHRTCAEYAVTTCPFLTKPRMRRNHADLPETRAPGGMMIERNPGVTLLWVTHDYKVMKTDTGPIIRMGEPVEIVAYAGGGLATREELDASIASGLPLLAQECTTDDDREHLRKCIDRADRAFKEKLKLLVPA